MYNIKATWNNMKSRCYSGYYAAYEDCIVCEEWLNDYRAFAEWFVDNIYNCNGETLELDKDLFSKGKKIYSPQTCCLLPKRINVLLSHKPVSSEQPYMGVTHTKSGRYEARIVRGVGHLVKRFDTPEEAADFYFKTKTRYIQEAAKVYKKYLPESIYEALINYDYAHGYTVTPVTQ